MICLVFFIYVNRFVKEVVDIYVCGFLKIWVVGYKFIVFYILI